MRSSDSKKRKISESSGRLHTPDPPELDSSVGGLSSSTSIHFNSSPPVSRLLISQSPRLPQRTKLPLQSFGLFKRPATVRASSPIASSEGTEAILLSACQSVKTAEKEGLDGAPVQFSSEEEDNNAFLNKSSSEESSSEEYSSEEEDINSSDEDEWNDAESLDEPDQVSQKASWIDSGATVNGKKKLIRILKGETLIPQQRWSLRKILATLLYHRKDPVLRSFYRQFRHFAYHTMMVETKKAGRWPGALMKKDVDSMINLRIRTEFEKRCNREVQNLCNTSGFGMVKQTPGDLNREPLESIVPQAKNTAPLLSSLVFGVGPTSCLKTSMRKQQLDMKLVAVLSVLCRSAHRNNSNYLPLLIALYLYSAGARIDAITLLNHLGLSVSYDVLQKKLKDITSSSMAWIKKQSTNCKLVGSWDNFEYRENVHGERMGDTVKFRSVTMALWVKNGWRIPSTGLKQWMWDGTRDLLQSREVIDTVFGSEGAAIRKLCIRSHRFNAFRAGFPNEEFSYAVNMPSLNVINCQKEGRTEAFAFAPSMFNESSTAGNIGVFEDLNVIQMGIEKDDPRWADWLTIWWGDLKTQVRMLAMQTVGIGMNRPYDQYQHLFPGLALWHLRFNYLKMVWEMFYPGGSATERSTLQWAANHWHRDKTTKPTDFHSLEDLTIHSYRARVIAMMKTWVQAQAPAMQMHDSVSLGAWFYFRACKYVSITSPSYIILYVFLIVLAV